MATPDFEPQPAVQSRTRILVVDDDERNLLALSEVLHDIADVVRAGSGEEALRHLLKERFAVIILDVLMPGLDGYETARLVRSRNQSRDTPIIFLTAINKEDAHLMRGYDSGAVDYVFKPFEPAVVRSKVSVFVALHEKSAEIERKAALEQQLLHEKLQAQKDHTRAVEALRQAEERQALILRSLPIALYVEEHGSGSPRFVAGDIASLTGFDASAFMQDATLWRTRLHPDDDAYFLRTRPGGRNGQFRWRHADDSYRFFLDQAVPSPDRDGDLAGTLRDITEQRLLQDQLLQAQKMDAIGKLTGGIAHDFNNLLASVLSGLSLLERRVELNDKALDVLKMTRHAADQGKNLVSRLLAFSRRQNLAPQIVNLASINQSLDGLLAPVLGGLVRLEWDVASDLWNTFVDPSQFELAAMNLVINSRDAMPNGGVITIRFSNSTVEAADDLPGGDYVVATVSDTGTGIPDRLIAQVIEPFFTTKDVGKGTGLGLSMAYGFARQSGGALRIRSVAGRGTDVEIWLPRSRGYVAQSPLEVTGPTVSRSLKHMRILLVDDSAELLRLTQMQLSDEGYQVTCAAGGVEAVALIERNQADFDVIVTDFAMPFMTGLDVIKFARSVRCDWPAVIISGYADTKAMSERPDDVQLISKPFSLDSLQDAIEIAFASGSSTGS